MKLKRADAARLGHYKQNLRRLATVSPHDGPLRCRQLDAVGWYPKARGMYTEGIDARLTADLLALPHGAEQRAILWVGACLSPMTTVAQNLTDTRKFFTEILPRAVRMVKDGLDPYVLLESDRLTAYPANVQKCMNICLGVDPIRFHEGPPGPKVGAFYRALMGAFSGPVVDTWMLRAAKAPAKSYTRSMRLVSRALTELWEEHQRGHWDSGTHLPNVHALQALIWSNIREANW